jgi:hypothetical protein
MCCDNYFITEDMIKKLNELGLYIEYQQEWSVFGVFCYILKSGNMQAIKYIGKIHSKKSGSGSIYRMINDYAPKNKIQEIQNLFVDEIFQQLSYTILYEDYYLDDIQLLYTNYPEKINDKLLDKIMKDSDTDEDIFIWLFNNTNNLFSLMDLAIANNNMHWIKLVWSKFKITNKNLI